MTVSAIVLAGGRSSRFGRDKLEADLAARSVLARAVEAVRPVVDEVLVVGRAGELPRVTYVADARPFEGPLVGLATGLRVAHGETVLVVGGDMALLQAGVLLLLLDRLRAADHPAAAALTESGAVRPLPLAVARDPARRATEAALAAGERSLRSLLASLPVALVDESAWRTIDPAGDTLLDIDTPEELARARARLDRGS